MLDLAMLSSPPAAADLADGGAGAHSAAGRPLAAHRGFLTRARSIPIRQLYAEARARGKRLVLCGASWNGGGGGGGAAVRCGAGQQLVGQRAGHCRRGGMWQAPPPLLRCIPGSHKDRLRYAGLSMSASARLQLHACVQPHCMPALCRPNQPACVFPDLQATLWVAPSPPCAPSSCCSTCRPRSMPQSGACMPAPRFPAC